ncbi:hypothetical protein J3459_007700 [Metarhizium acridum]|uniref:uncharacterized protein n=1 Tax=Metarhizium acridum TaxID=92637 RepID=UPI001C6B584B|nr:hypothetical protein J3458_003092 [Metarhizium acridum]KAG8426922.1 hypothetical protein J3459_007700 [Metarhizium acridum]
MANGPRRNTLIKSWPCNEAVLRSTTLQYSINPPGQPSHLEAVANFNSPLQPLREWSDMARLGGDARLLIPFSSQAAVTKGLAFNFSSASNVGVCIQCFAAPPDL